MTRLEIIKAILAERPKLEAEGVAHLAIFGSRARGDNRPDSDIDVLIDVGENRKFSFFNLTGVSHIIQDATGIETGVTMRNSMSDRFSYRIEDDIIEIF